MTQIAIVDRQPIFRLGLNLLIKKNYHSCSIHEANSFDEFCATNTCDDLSVFILGLDFEKDRIDQRLIKNIKKKFPKSRLVLYADHIKSMVLITCFRNGISAYLSRQTSESEIIECLKTVFDNKRYLSTQNFNNVVKDVKQYPGFVIANKLRVQKMISH